MYRTTAIGPNADSSLRILPKGTPGSHPACPADFLRRHFLAACAVTILASLCVPAHADPMAVFGTAAALTPEIFIHHFSDFTFELGQKLQPPERFLARKKGDCDDFASLASSLLSRCGYHTKLVVVVMPPGIHVVCYVKEISGFLDFNSRSKANPVVRSGADLEDIAAKVAVDFRSDWLTASEFVYLSGSRHFLNTVFR